MTSDDKAHCLLVDGNNTDTDGHLPVADVVLYGATKITLNASCSTRTFAFEKLPNLETKTDTIILEHGAENVDLERCLDQCHERTGCRAVQYNRRNSTCDLLNASTNTVYNVRSHFQYGKDIDIYENNCGKVPMSSTKCSFMRLNAAGYTDYYDEIVEGVGDVEECERICVVQTNVVDPCRSYTYDRTSQRCYISHYDGRSSGRSPLSSRNPNLTHGSLDDCIDLRNTSNLPFSRFEMPQRCARNPRVLNAAVQIHPFPSFSGLVHVKEGSTSLVTIRDKLLQVHCRIHSQVEISDQTITAHMDVRESNRTERVLSDLILHSPAVRPLLPRYSLRVLNSDGVETDVNAQNHISVSNVLARDINTKEVITLIGDDGCVVHDSVTGISRTSPEELRYKINFGGLHEQAQLIYQALVETCSFDCSPKCNKKLWLNDLDQIDENDNALRRRRSIGPRQIELTQDIYKVHGSRITVLTPLTSKHYVDSMKVREQTPTLPEERHMLSDDDVHVEVVETRPISSALEQCFSEDITCLFTVILASIQLFLLASCMCIVYCYIQQWRSYRSFHESMPSQIEYELHGRTNVPKPNNAQVD
ncbi:unnamed protein product [Heligmosomoides polygyrus]|uniref:PAN domain protein n=1 Tax=Heligmosomoides polygyrus TaxID=6339 RepID=A0A3P8CGZ0_HELPZ|nr:unnamed protein product [Heligmosomoides polygyrus]